MPLRSVLTTAQLEALFASPETDEERASLYIFDAPELAIIHQRRGAHNRLGFAVQLCYLRYPGHALEADTVPPVGLLAFVARRGGASADVLADCAQREETRREHLREVQ